MALFGKYVDAYVSISGVDLSNHCKQVTINYSAAMLDASAMGDLTKVNMAGILDWSMTFELEQDYAAGSVDATLWGIMQNGVAVTLAVRPKKSVSKGAENPEFGGQAVLASYNPASGQHGALLLATATFQCAGTLARTTS